MSFWKEIPLADAIARPDRDVALHRAVEWNLMFDQFQIDHHRGYTVLTGRERKDHDFCVLVKKGLHKHPLDFAAHVSKEHNEDDDEYLGGPFDIRAKAIAAGMVFINGRLL